MSVHTANKRCLLAGIQQDCIPKALSLGESHV